MSKLLVVEDEAITSDLLRRYFEIVGYEVVNSLTGHGGVKIAVEEQPVVIILDIMLPDMDGYEVAKTLRQDERTKNIPIIFLTQKDDRRDKLMGLSLGVDDYITKPFDVDELRLRVHNIIDRMGGTPLVDPRTSLPNTQLIKERLPRLLDKSDTIFLNAKITGLADFGLQYGPVAENQVIRSTAKLINDILRQVDPSRSFIGHPSDDQFLIATSKAAAEELEKRLVKDFKSRAKNFYDYGDQERGKMKIDKEGQDREAPFMSLHLTRVKAEALKALASQSEEKGEVSKPKAKKSKPSPPPQKEKPSEEAKQN